MHLSGKKILLVITGGIAAYKSLELIRLLKKQGANVRCILTAGGAQFITPLAVSSLTGEKTYTELWSLTDETEMGHIRLTREADVVVVAPATANIIAKLAQGIADDLASTTLLASDKDILIAPAMNWAMWENASVQDNLRTLQARGLAVIAPTTGDMACGEHGMGRLAEPEDILKAIDAYFAPKPLVGIRALVTAGPTREAIDPVRYLSNHSSGKQGYAIAAALARAGADVRLVSGPVDLPVPKNVQLVKVESAQQMLDACLHALPADVVVCAAAVADWRAAEPATQKLKKSGDAPQTLTLIQNPDILHTLATHKTQRPRLVVGFAAETENFVAHAIQKRNTKGCDWIVGNDVLRGVFGADTNTITLVDDAGAESWPTLPKTEIAAKLVTRIIHTLKGRP